MTKRGGYFEHLLFYIGFLSDVKCWALWFEWVYFQEQMLSGVVSNNRHDIIKTVIISFITIILTGASNSSLSFNLPNRLLGSVFILGSGAILNRDVLAILIIADKNTLLACCFEDVQMIIIYSKSKGMPRLICAPIKLIRKEIQVAIIEVLAQGSLGFSPLIREVGE